MRRTDSDKFGLRLQGLYDRRTVDGVRETAAQLWRFGTRYDRDLSADTYAFVGYDGEKDRLANLKWRHVPAAGAGLHLIKTPRHTADVFGGYSYNRERLYVGPTRSFHEALLGEETTHRLTDATSVRQRFALHPNLSESGEYRVVFDAGLVTALIENWSVTVSFSARYQSNPPPGAQKRDTLLFTGLQYTWGAPRAAAAGR